MVNNIEIRKTYFPCKICREYSLMYFNGYKFICRKGHIEQIEEHLKNVSFPDLCNIIRELLRERYNIQERIKAYNDGLINVKDLLKDIEGI